MTFFGDIADTPKEGTGQHRKQECLKSAIDKGKTHLLGQKWTHERVDKASHRTINKTYAEYRQRELNEKVKRLEGPWASMLLICIPREFLGGLKSRMLKNYTRTPKMTRSLKIK